MNIKISLTWLRNRSGQTMIEYVVMAVFIVLTVTIMSVLLYTFKEQGGRVLDLAASEYP